MNNLTLVARLSGPLQSWGTEGVYTTRSSKMQPTYSGLLGLCRAAIGSPRNSNPRDWDWLRNLSFTIRVDDPGLPLIDYHTVNPPPPYPSPTLEREWELFTVPQGKLKAGQKPELWTTSKLKRSDGRRVISTLVSHRGYVTGAVFTLLVSGPAPDIKQLAAALRRPKWALSLGRKACVPDWPLLLGVSTSTVQELLSEIPAAGTNVSQTVEVHLLGPTPPHWPQTVNPTTWNDDPIGSHPHHGHTPRQRGITHVTAERTTRDALLKWAAQNLETEP